MAIEIEVAREATPELLRAMDRLIPQLSRSNPPPSHDELAAIVSSRATVMLIARDTDRGDDQIVGSLTLALFRIPTAMRAWIEDVVVDESARGQGVGEALNQAALDHASKAGAKTVDLTSRPSRESANRLYKRLGFERRDTNVYRYDLGRSSPDKHCKPLGGDVGDIGSA